MAKKKKEKKGGKRMKKKELVEMLITYQLHPHQAVGSIQPQTVVSRTQPDYSSTEDALCRHRSGNGRR